jgi:MFS family permease
VAVNQAGYRALPARVRLFMAGQFLSWLGDGIYLLAIPWLVYDITGSAVAIGASYALQFAPYAVQPLLEILMLGILKEGFR